MTYATKSNIDDAYGADLLNKIADNDRSGVADPETVERGLRSADGIINGYLQAQYTLPLAGTSDLLIELAVDIAVYKICLQRGVRTTEMRVRYEDALSTLKDIAKGIAGIGIVPDPDSGEPTTPGTSGPRQSGRSIDTFRS